MITGIIVYVRVGPTGVAIQVTVVMIVNGKSGESSTLQVATGASLILGVCVRKYFFPRIFFAISRDEKSAVGAVIFS